MLATGQVWEKDAGFSCVRFEDGRPVTCPGGDVMEAAWCGVYVGSKVLPARKPTEAPPSV